MIQVEARGEELNGIGRMIKSLMEGNLGNREMSTRAASLKGSLVMKDPGTGVAATVFFNNGEISIQNGAVARPSAFVEAGFDTLGEISSGRLAPMIKALMSKKVKARGNLLKLLKMARVILPPPEG
jgi:putative sterol carrier protein